MDAGRVDISGALKAESVDSKPGGFIETSAAQVNIAESVQISTKSAGGQAGTWLIDPADYIIAASGGNITGATLSDSLNESAITIEVSTEGNGNGGIFVNDTVSWASNKLTLRAHHNIYINQQMNGTVIDMFATERGRAEIHKINQCHTN